MNILGSFLILMLRKTLYLVIVVSACDDFWRYIFTVRSCDGGGAHCEVAVCLLVGSPRFNDTDLQLIDFNISQGF